MKGTNEQARAGRRKANGEGAIRQRPNGLWEARALVAGKRRSIYGRTKREVVEKLASQSTDARRGRFMEPSRESVAEFLRYWLSAVAAQRVTEGTLRNYRSQIERHVIPRIGTVRLQHVSTATINRLLADLADDGRSPNLRAAIRKTLHRALRIAAREHRIFANPVSESEPPKVERSERRALSDAERTALLRAARARGPRLAAIVTLAVETGLRLGELSALRWSDVDDGALRVRRSLREEKVVRNDAGGRVRGGLVAAPPKTKAGERSVPLSIDAQAALAALRSALPVAPHPTAPLLTAPDGGWLRKSNFGRREWAPLRDAAKLAGYPFHGLRHTFLTRCARAGVHVKVAQRLAGHASERMTLGVYTHVADDDLRAAIERLG